jgi:hypothetical protein
MLRIAMVALVLGTAPAWAYKPLVCEIPKSEPRERWLIDGRQMSQQTNPGVTVYQMTKHRKRGQADGWRLTIDGESHGGLTITNRRHMLWFAGGTGKVRGVCHEANHSVLTLR